MIRSTLKRVARKVLRKPKTEPRDPAMQPRTAPVAPTSSPPQDRTEPVQQEKLSLTRDNVEKVLMDDIAPALAADGGGVELVSVEGSKVEVCLTGACHGCPSAQMTLRSGVERVLRDKIEGIDQVSSV